MGNNIGSHRAHLRPSQVGADEYYTRTGGGRTQKHTGVLTRVQSFALEWILFTYCALIHITPRPLS